MPENTPEMEPEMTPEMARKMYLMAKTTTYHVVRESFWKRILLFHLIVDVIMIINYILFSPLFAVSYFYDRPNPSLIDTGATKQAPALDSGSIIFDDFKLFDLHICNDEFGPV